MAADVEVEALVLGGARDAADVGRVGFQDGDRRRWPCDSR